jgi:hypothetical protein
VHAVADSLFNGLVALDRNLRPVPDLATAWTISDDSTVFTFTLAQARWHDGTPLTSADVKFTFEEVLFKYHARTKAGLGAIVDHIDTPDDRTVAFHLKKPYGAFLQGLDVTEAPILPKHLFASGDPNTNPANLKPVGTGPFRLESYRAGAAARAAQERQPPARVTRARPRGGADAPAAPGRRGLDEVGVRQQQQADPAAGFGRELQASPGHQVGDLLVDHQDGAGRAGGAEAFLERPETILRPLCCDEHQIRGGDAKPPQALRPDVGL